MLALYHFASAMLIGIVNESWLTRLLASVAWSAFALSIPWLRLQGYSTFVLFVSLALYVFALASAAAFVKQIML